MAACAVVGEVAEPILNPLGTRRQWILQIARGAGYRDRTQAPRDRRFEASRFSPRANAGAKQEKCADDRSNADERETHKGNRQQAFQHRANPSDQMLTITTASLRAPQQHLVRGAVATSGVHPSRLRCQSWAPTLSAYTPRRCS